MKICAACCEELTKESFSKKQWQMKQHQRRCKECIDANRVVQLKAPPKNDTAGGNQNSPPLCAADNEGVSCWICLEEGPDELEGPLVRDCSCRGESGFAHLSCIIQYAEQKSRSCVEESDNGIKMNNFMGPWERCPNCKQKYTNKIALDLANAFLTFTESNWPESNWPENEGIRLRALNMKLRALAEGSDQMKELKEIANKMLSMVRQFKMKHSSPSESILEIEACVHFQLGRFHLKEGTKESSKIAVKHYEICRDILKSIGHKQGVAAAEANLARAKAKCDGTRNDVGTEEEMEKHQQLYTQSLDQAGDEHPSTIILGINTATILHRAHHAIEAERLLSKIAIVSNRVHGPAHELTQQAELSLKHYKARYVVLKNERSWILFRALRYGHDGETIIANGPISIGVSSPGDVPEGKTITFATKDVIHMKGTPVVCHGLIKANYLNGKLGDIRQYDGKTDRYEVHFEDEGIKPCLVKPGNVSILFELSVE